MDLFALFSLAVVAGGVSFTSPCTLPLLPGYVSYVSGLSDPWGEGARLAPADRRRVRLGAGLFVLGFTLVFTALGASASALGLLLVRNLAVVNLVGGAVIVVMGLVTAGMLSWTLPGFPLRWGMSARWGRGPGGALPLGAAFAAGWTPCVGPVLAAILATAAGTPTVGRGALLLVGYSLGLGVPFLLLADGLARGRGRWTWLRRQGRRIEVAGGLLLVVMGVAVASGGWTAVMSGMLRWYARLGWPPI